MLHGGVGGRWTIVLELLGDDEQERLGAAF